MSLDMFSLEGKRALITGASRGIGAAIGIAFAEAGADVALSARSESDLEDVAGKARATGRNAVPITCDVTQRDQVYATVERAIAELGGLDILVNNAGVGLFANVADMTLDQWRQVIETNLSGVFYCCHAAIPQLRRRGGGWIINISSLAGKNAFVGGAAYCASKAGLNQFSEALMQEVRYDDIRVSYVMPGSVSTGFSGRGERGAADWKLAAEDVAQVVMDLVAHPARSLPSRVELRPSRPQK